MPSITSGSGASKDALLEQFARVGKALANPKRLELLDVLAQGERSVEALAEATSLKLTTASAHLQAMRNGGLVVSRKEGTRVFYRLASDRVVGALVALREVASTHLAETKRAAGEYLGEDTVEPVGRADLVDRLRSGRYLLLDVRPREEFDAGHIEGALSVPLDELVNRISELPRDVEIVAYCRGTFCALSYNAVRMLRAKGWLARRLEGGMLEWLLEQRPVIGGS